MLCSLIVALALLACVLAEKSLRQAAPAAAPVAGLTKAHKSFQADYERRSQFRGLVDLDAEPVAMVAQNGSMYPSHIRFTGNLAQMQNSESNSFLLMDVKLGTCHNSYKPRKNQLKSSMFYMQYSDQPGEPIHLHGQYYLAPNCDPDKFLTEGEFMTTPWFEDGAQAYWGSKFPKHMGLVETFYFGSECPAGPLPPQQGILSLTSTPLGACQNEDSGGSHLMNGCYIANGKVYVNGLGFDQQNCTGPASPIADMSVGKSCKASRNSFQVTTCVLP